MKISKRPNGGFVMRVDVVEATVKGDLSIKDAWALYEKLAAAIARDEAKVKETVEAATTEKTEGQLIAKERPRNLKERVEAIVAILKEKPEATERELKEWCGAAKDNGRVWSVALQSLFKKKKITYRKADPKAEPLYSLVAKKS